MTTSQQDPLVAISVLRAELINAKAEIARLEAENKRLRQDKAVCRCPKKVSDGHRYTALLPTAKAASTANNSANNNKLEQSTKSWSAPVTHGFVITAPQGCSERLEAARAVLSLRSGTPMLQEDGGGGVGGGEKNSSKAVSSSVGVSESAASGSEAKIKSKKGRDDGNGDSKDQTSMPLQDVAAKAASKAIDKGSDKRNKAVSSVSVSKKSVACGSKAKIKSKKGGNNDGTGGDTRGQKPQHDAETKAASKAAVDLVSDFNQDKLTRAQKRQVEAIMEEKSSVEPPSNHADVEGSDSARPKKRPIVKPAKAIDGETEGSITQYNRIFIQQTLLGLLRKVRKEVDAYGFFSKPVDPIKDACPDYFDIVDRETEAMDLDTMEEMIESGNLCTVDEFETMLKRIALCCRKYNSDPNHDVRQEGDKIMPLSAPLLEQARKVIENRLAVSGMEIAKEKEKQDDGEEEEREVPVETGRRPAKRIKTGKDAKVTTVESSKATPPDSRSRPAKQIKTSKDVKITTVRSTKAMPSDSMSRAISAVSQSSGTQYTRPQVEGSGENYTRIFIQQTLLGLLRKVRKEVDEYGFFSRPVDPIEDECPDYFDIVDREREAMDLDTMEDMIESGMLSTIDEFETMLKRIVLCCRKYNTDPENGVREEGDKIMPRSAPLLEQARKVIEKRLVVTGTKVVREKKNTVAETIRRPVKPIRTSNKSKASVVGGSKPSSAGNRSTGGNKGGGKSGPVEVFDRPAPEIGKGWTVKCIARPGRSRVDSYWFSPKTKKRLRSNKQIERFKAALKKCNGDEDKAFAMIK